MSKFPFYKQLDGMDCGPTCLRMIAKYYGKTFSVQQLREQSYIQRTGVNLLGISEAAASIGLRATGIRTSMDKLKQQSKLPCIIHWNQEHFVVLYKIEKKKGKTWFYIADPAYGLLKYENVHPANAPSVSPPPYQTGLVFNRQILAASVLQSFQNRTHCSFIPAIRVFRGG